MVEGGGSDCVENIDKWKAEVFTEYTSNNDLMSMNGESHAAPERGRLLLYD